MSKKPRYLSESKDFIPTCLADIMTDAERAELDMTPKEEEELFRRLMKDVLNEARAADRKARRAAKIANNWTGGKKKGL